MAKKMETATFKVDKECKHSRRYACQDPEFPIRSIYIWRISSEGKDKIEVGWKEKEELK